MKKLVSLAIVLFFAATAFAEEYVASQKITQQVLSGELAQTVYAGDDIEPVKILLAMILNRLKFYMKILALTKIVYQNIHRRTFWKILA